MKQAFIEKRFRADSLERIEQANEIIAEYAAQGFKLTLRQLYYQFVSRDIIPNSEKSYKGLGSLISDGRLAGMIDWDAIEDRGRQPRTPQEFESLSDLIEVATRAYRLPRWKDQENYVELWVEKDALAGVLAPLANEFHVTLMVNKGYSSQSAMFEAASRFIEHEDRNGILFYLGDHDPSGEDMVRDIRGRLRMFDASVEVKKLALTIAQVRQFNPPPNPTKISDSRATSYIEKFGHSSWEVDALPPQELARIIRQAIRAVVDQDLVNEIIEREEEDKAELRRVAEERET